MDVLLHNHDGDRRLPWQQFCKQAHNTPQGSNLGPPPSIDREGEYSINFCADMELKSGINAHNAYGGEVKNKANAGITNERLKELWDAEHPADPLVIP